MKMLILSFAMTPLLQTLLFGIGQPADFQSDVGIAARDRTDVVLPACAPGDAGRSHDGTS
jgi:hypothetical protein